MVARERFELSSAGPKPTMLDHYTTGLLVSILRAKVLTMPFFPNKDSYKKQQVMNGKSFS
jgi:hypothetical protein